MTCRDWQGFVELQICLPTNPYRRLKQGNICVTRAPMVDIRYYVDVGGDAPFAEWFAELEPVASARITRAIARMEQGNFSNAKGVGEGVLECKIDFGPG